MKTPQIIHQLVERFREHRQSYFASGYKEAQLRQEFIDPMLKALGWDIENESGYAEAYKDVISEDALKIGGTTKAPDYSFRVGGVRKFFLEAKKPSVSIRSELDPAFQLRRYGWSAKLSVSILTNFDELAVYDCRIPPKKEDRPSVARISVLRFEEYVQEWDQLASIFSRESILKGSFDNFAERSKLKRGTLQVDAAFLEELKSWRKALAVNIAKRNAGITQRQLNSAVQTIIDRIIFLRICEDRGIEVYGTLRRASEKKGIYSSLVDLFKKADVRYNSGLFFLKKDKGRPGDLDDFTPSLDVSDEVLRGIVFGLYYPESPYEFSVLTTEILGQVYEQFLGQIITLTAQGKAATVVNKPDVRKKGGVYYTPTWVVDYIVEATLGPLLSGKTPAQAASLRIVDPACGSGSFLLGVYRYLLAWHRDWYIKEGHSKHAKGKTPKLRQSPQTGRGWKLTAAEKKRILLNSVFGVDIDPQAVQVTQLSLLLKVLEEESIETITAQLKLFHERALPDLSRNIRSGNSLVGSNFLSGLQSMGLCDEDMLRINPFEWKEEFADVFSVKGAGFDLVVGNPPYAYRKATESDLRDYYKDNYVTAEGNFELYKFFVERSLSLLTDGGKLGFIVSASWLVQPSFEKLRRLVTQQMTLEQVCPLGPGVFQDATVDTTILIASNGSPRSGHSVSISAPASGELPSLTRAYKIKQRRFANNSGCVIDYRLTEAGAAIVNRLLTTLPTIETMYEFGVGINTGFIRDELVSERRLDNRYHRMVSGRGISRYGAVTTDGWIMYDAKFVRSKGNRGRSLPEERFLSSEKILVVRTRNLALSRRIIATIDETSAYNLNRLSNIIARPGASLPALLAILNSELFQWLFSTRYFDYEIKPVYLRSSPLAANIPASLGRDAKDMLRLNATLGQAKTAAEKANLRRRMEVLDVRIDEATYEAYEITDSERTVVRDHLQQLWRGGTGGAGDVVIDDDDEDEDEDA